VYLLKMSSENQAPQPDLGKRETNLCDPVSSDGFRRKARLAGFNEAEIEKLIADYHCIGGIGWQACDDGR
jgi:hypothetical protein